MSRDKTIREINFDVESLLLGFFPSVSFEIYACVNEICENDDEVCKLWALVMISFEIMK